MEERNEKIGMIMANYAELQKRDDGESNALIKREDWNKIIMEILEWHDSEVKKLNIPVVMESVCEHEWLNDSFDHFGILQEQICDKCGLKQTVL